MNNYLIKYRCKDEKLHTIQLQTALNKEDVPELQKMIGFKNRRHRPIKIISVNTVEG